MFYRRNWIIGTVVILGLVMFVPLAQAQRQDVEFTVCNAVTYNVVQSTPEVGVTAYEAKAIIRSTNESKVFDNWTGQGVGVLKRIGDKLSVNGLTKRMGPDGEFIIWEIHRDPESEAIWKPVYGTGKWKGIKGEVKSKRITAGKPIIQGTEQYCDNNIGWIELAK
jgi:hypothetical protein